MAAALHVGLAVHNFGIQEHMPHTALTDEVFPHAYRFEAGYLPLAKSLVWELRSMRNWQHDIPTNTLICRLHANSMARSQISEQ
jgi:hypothetical protein